MRALVQAFVGLSILAAPAWLGAQTWRAEHAEPAALGFGAAVVLRGSDLYVGRIGMVAGFPMPSAEKGSVHLFRQGADGGWTETGTVTAGDGAGGDGFGWSLARDGNLLAVGAPRHGTGGAVYVYEGQGTTWTQVAKLSLPDGAEGDQFGLAIGLEGGLLVVGAPGRDSARGTVHAFRHNAQGWSAPVLVARGAAAADQLGRGLSVSGGKVLVGAPGPLGMGGPQGPAPRAGRAAIYGLSGGAWREEAALVPGTDSTIAYGVAVHLAEGRAIVSAPGTARMTGVVYVFQSSGGAWSLAARVRPAAASPMTRFGMSVGASGSTLMVGAPMAQQGVGAVYVFSRDGDTWSERQQLTVPPAGLGVQFGAAIGLDGDAAVIGGPMGDFFSGTGYTYSRSASGEWVAAGTIADKPEGLPAITGGEVRCEDGKVGLFACQEVDLLSFLPTSDLGAKRGIMVNDIWGWTDQASGREFALVGRMDGTSFVEITDPARPVFLGDLPMHAGARANLWRDIKVYRDHAFIVADGSGPHGMQVFNLRRLLSVSDAPATFTEDAHYDRIASAHNIAINEATGYAYTIGNSGGGETCGGALHMIDIREPRNPKFAGCFADPSTGNQRTGYTHDNQCVVYRGPDLRYQGREVCFNASETAVGIADVTDKANPKPIAVASYPNTAYAHQGWLSEDHRHFFLNDEGDELSGLTPKTRTLVWDVTKLDEPVLVSEFQGGTAASDHNLYIRGNYMFQSNYVAGLRVIDISDPANPKETGYFDTVPWGENAPGFAGSWSNYPFFPSGTIIVTSMREGLFVLRHRPSRPLVP